MHFSGKFDPAAGLAQSGIAGTSPTEPAEEAAAEKAASTSASSPTSSESSKKEEQPEKPKETTETEEPPAKEKKEETTENEKPPEPEKMEVDSKEEEETKSTKEDGEESEAKEKTDKVMCHLRQSNPKDFYFSIVNLFIVIVLGREGRAIAISGGGSFGCSGSQGQAFGGRGGKEDQVSGGSARWDANEKVGDQVAPLWGIGDDNGEGTRGPGVSATAAHYGEAAIPLGAIEGCRV